MSDDVSRRALLRMSALADHNSHFSATRPEFGPSARFVLVQPQHFKSLARQRVERVGRFDELGLGGEVFAVLLEPPPDARGKSGLWLHYSVGLGRGPESGLGQFTLSRRLFDHLGAELLLGSGTRVFYRCRFCSHVAGRGRWRHFLVLGAAGARVVGARRH